MEFPQASENIFPASKENFVALMDHYFPKAGDGEKSRSLKLWLEKEQKLHFALNQIEFGGRFCRENEVVLNMYSFSYIPAARIYYLLMSLFLPLNEWDQTTKGAHRKKLVEFRQMFLHQPDMFNKIDTTGYLTCNYPKTKSNLNAILDFYFPGAGDAERKLSLIEFIDSRETLSYIHYAAQFCTKNHSFLDEVGVSTIPSERIHDVITAIFRPSYTWLPGEFEKDGENCKKLKDAYLSYISINKVITPTNSKI